MRNVNNISIYSDSSIIDAMDKMTKNSSKTLFVVDKKKKLLGTLTDGDIRRYVLSGNGLNSSIAKVFNNKPLVLNNENKNNIKKKLNFFFDKYGVDSIPVINSNGILTDYLKSNDNFDQQVSKFSNKIKEKISLVIMAGGLGTRMQPFTNILPKPLVPIKGRPLINHILDNFVNAGIDNIHVSVRYKGNIIRAYLAEEYPNNSKIKIFEEKSPRGTAGSLKDIDLSNKLTFVINCDVLIDIDLFDLYSFHKKSKSDLTIVASAKNLTLPYGSCEIDDKGHLLCIREKPSYPHLVNTGLYLIENKIVDIIPKNGSYDMDKLINDAIKQNVKVKVFPISSDAWLDIGQWDEYRQLPSKNE
jgi:dTDP-glucose pyrophosphorylase